VDGDVGKITTRSACRCSGRFNPDQTRRCRVDRSYLEDRRVALEFSCTRTRSDVAVTIGQDRLMMRTCSGLYTARISGSGMTTACRGFLSRTLHVSVDS